MRALTILLVMLLGCGSSTGYNPIPGDTKTTFGNTIIYNDLPGRYKIEAVTKIASYAGNRYSGWTFSIEAYPVTYPYANAPLSTGSKDGHLIVTSYTDFNFRVVHLGWKINADQSLWLEDIPYELANIDCGCESGLKK